MSMHKIPLSQLEEDGLRAHGLDIGTPSQLSDVFRHGIAWAQKSQLEAIRAAGGEVVADDLIARCAEILEWQKSGVLSGNALRSYAAGKRYSGDHNELQIAEADTAREAYKFVTQHQRIVAAMAAELEMARTDLAYFPPTVRALTEKIAELRAELEAARKQEPVATVEQREPYEDGTPHPGRSLRWSGNNAEDDLPVGATLYMLPPLAGQVVAPEWVPVSERLPDHGAPVLVAYKFGGVYTCRRSVIDHDLAADEPMHGERDRPTHWMPLPAAPALLATPSMEVNS